MKRQRITITILIFLSVMVPSLAFACSTPVFRYALERWAADYYEAVFIHQGPLSQEEKQLLGELQQEGSEDEALLNLRVLDIDVASTTEEKVKTLLMSEQMPDKLATLIGRSECVSPTLSGNDWSSPGWF